MGIAATEIDNPGLFIPQRLQDDEEARLTFQNDLEFTGGLMEPQGL